MIFIPSQNAQLAEEANRCFDGKACFFNGENIPSYSWMINQCIVQASDELVIICNDRARPEAKQLQKLISLLDDGYGLVGLHRFGFYGFYKDLIRRIGFFDERFIKGTYEDCDMVRRIKEANIAYFESEEVLYVDYSSRFNSENSAPAVKFFCEKWLDADVTVRLLPDEERKYDIGFDTGRVFKPWSESVMLGLSGSFKDIPFENRVKQ